MGLWMFSPSRLFLFVLFAADRALLRKSNAERAVFSPVKREPQERLGDVSQGIPMRARVVACFLWPFLRQGRRQRDLKRLDVGAPGLGSTGPTIPRRRSGARPCQSRAPPPAQGNPGGSG